MEQLTVMVASRPGIVTALGVLRLGRAEDKCYRQWYGCNNYLRVEVPSDEKRRERKLLGRRVKWKAALSMNALSIIWASSTLLVTQLQASISLIYHWRHECITV